MVLQQDLMEFRGGLNPKPETLNTLDSEPQTLKSGAYNSGRRVFAAVDLRERTASWSI